MDEYRVRRGIQRDHGSGDQGWLELLYSLRIDRNYSDITHHLVRMDLAKAANPLIAVTTQNQGQGRLSSNEPSNCVVLPLVFAQRIIRAHGRE